MGRASRRKANNRKERQPREVWIQNPRTGLMEMHTVTISTASLLEWMGDRERLTGQGYPDRPPTFDDPKVRVWSDWGDVPGDPPRAVSADPLAERFVMSWAVRHPEWGLECKVFAFQSTDPADFLIRYKAISPLGSVDATEGRCSTWEEILSVVEGFLAAWRESGFQEPNVLTADYLTAVRSRLGRSARDQQGSAAA